MKNIRMCSVPDEQGPNRQMLRRALLLMAVCGAAAFALLLAKLCQIQLLEHDFYEQRALEQQLREAPAPRAGAPSPTSKDGFSPSAPRWTMSISALPRSGSTARTGS